MEETCPAYLKLFKFSKHFNVVWVEMFNSQKMCKHEDAQDSWPSNGVYGETVKIMHTLLEKDLHYTFDNFLYKIVMQYKCFLFSNVDSHNSHQTSGDVKSEHLGSSSIIRRGAHLWNILHETCFINIACIIFAGQCTLGKHILSNLLYSFHLNQWKT